MNTVPLCRAPPGKVHRPQFLVTVIGLPQRLVTLAADRMNGGRRNFRQWQQHEGVFQDLAPGQLDTIDPAHLVIVGENIQVQCSGTELWHIPPSTIVRLKLLEAGRQLGHAQVGIDAHHQIVEGRAIKTDRLALVDR